MPARDIRKWNQRPSACDDPGTDTESMFQLLFEHSADAILLLASLLDEHRLADYIALLDAYGCDALVEVHDEDELARATKAGARLIGVNNRDLRSFAVDLATSERLGALMPEDVIRVAESGIRTRADVERLRAAGFHAFLVGESLLRQHDRAAAVQELR